MLLNNKNIKKYQEHNVFKEGTIDKLDSSKVRSVLHEISNIIKHCKIYDNKDETNEELENKIKIQNIDYNDIEKSLESNNAYLRLLTRKINDKEFNIFTKNITKITIYGTNKSPLFSIDELSNLLGDTIKNYHYKNIVEDKLLHYKFIAYIQIKIKSIKNSIYEYKIAPKPFITRPGLNYIIMKLRTNIALMFKEYINVVLEMLMNDEDLSLKKVKNNLIKKYNLSQNQNKLLENKCAQQNYMINNLNTKIKTLKKETNNYNFNIIDLDYLMFKIWKKQFTKPLNIVIFSNSKKFEENIFKYKKINNNDDDYYFDEDENEIEKYSRIINIPKKFQKEKEKDNYILNEIYRRKEKKIKLRNKLITIFNNNISVNSIIKTDIYQKNNDFIDICNYESEDCYNFIDDKWYYLKIEDPSRKKYKISNMMNDNNIVIIKDKINISGGQNKILNYINNNLKKNGCAIKMGKETYYEINYLFIKKLIHNFYINLR